MAKLLIILYIFIHRLKYSKNYFFTDSQNDLWAALNTLNSHQINYLMLNMLHQLPHTKHAC